ncbi:hypothetical protein UCRPA7_5362 [Phaeoacremonium minimum UCRPA7]|uniref:Hemerythrin-like domain-containing protein n=1 Tax=Phaeoacremonium minimum (strain UCR-PA7) TaxID=1286976 RepID=R8BIQ8_PHAM7|nr:hypothetical protein UCRPA7_5362 [Phaeoacremonium minimum UCRPA7]EON99132.1 hypothetical protein UCRPA7_5362 [Phaeoacremonium minimum UCRPA7]
MSSAAQSQPEPVPEAAGPEPPAPVPGPDAKKVIDECEKQKAEKKEDAQPEPNAEGTASASEPKLPPLSPAEFKTYNRLAQQMDYFHEHFRRSWNLLYNACSSGRRPANMSLKQFIDEGLHFTQYLTAHHNIEETYLFPLLARKMPEFKSGPGKGAAELLRQHREIHAGMDVFEDYLRRCRNRETELEMSVLKEKMETWGAVLWKHLDQEVKTLGAENMRKYWSIEEVRSLPI